MVRKVQIAALLAAAVVSTGCAKPGAYGEVTSIIVGAATELWDAIDDSLYAALEPRIFTVRDERTFEVTPIDPRDTPWARLRQWKQVVIFGTATDPWLEEPLREAADREVVAPSLHEANDVWARGQTVTLALLPTEAATAAALTLVEPLHELIDDRFWRYAQARMFITPADTTRERILAEQARFTLRVPGVYRASQRDSIYQFRNDNPSPAELIRSVLVTWRTPTPEPITARDVLEWRRDIVARAYDPSQITDTSHVEFGQLQMDGHAAFQAQAVWLNPPDLGFPAGGPFITRVVLCPEQGRTYLLDAWLYAPGKPKYEYMIQLLTILDSFRCMT
ncbi:MAG: DUF4837 family protein [Gemmatimonadetes bacterium]|nr:DUF4837 family protein [Gemmatimonadota bacterium]